MNGRIATAVVYGFWPVASRAKPAAVYYGSLFPEKNAPQQEEGDDEAAAEALAEVEPVSDEELEAIAKSIGRPRAAPEGTTALARRDPMLL